MTTASLQIEGGDTTFSMTISTNPGSGWTVSHVKQRFSWYLQFSHPGWQPIDMRLVAKDAPDHELVDGLECSSDEFKRALAVGLLVQRQLTLAELQRRLPAVSQASQAALISLLAHLQLGPRGLLDLASLTADKVALPADAEFPVSIIDNQLQPVSSQSIPTDHGVMHVVSMLPENAGVQLRGSHVFKYRAASVEYAAEVKRATENRIADIAHCEKLLRDLPVALKNSQAALAMRSRAADVDLTELGAMVLEQNCISDEIAARTLKLAELRASSIPKLDPTRFVAHTMQATAQLHFGFNSLGAKSFLLVQRLPLVVHQAAVSLRDQTLTVATSAPSEAISRVVRALDDPVANGL